MMIKGKKKAVLNMGIEENDLDAAQTNNKEQEDKNSKTHSTADEIPSTSKEGDELGNAKAEIGEVMEENQRLKMMLQKVKREYHSLQMTFFDVMKQDPQPKAPNLSRSAGPEEPEISLCLGRSKFEQKRENGINTVDNKDPTTLTKEDLALGLNLRCLSETNLSDRASEPLPAIEEMKDDKPEDSWPPSRTLKTTRNENDDLLPLNNKRARVSVRARCETPTMHDGCQWRKYGQKISKGNPCPRAYYRCTGAPSCPVRKQVQRCPEDLSILVTTYEGTHNHPLAVAATAMASTTAAAASILTSGSSTSEGAASSLAPTTTATTSTPSPTTANINGLTFALFDSSNIRQFNFPSASSPLPPTITLDLTANPSQFSNLLPGFSRAHKHSSSSISLDFSSSSLESTTLPTAWTGNNSRPNFSPSHFGKCSLSSVKFGKPLIPETLMSTRPSYVDHINPTQSSSSHSSQQFLTDTLTKVLTADPSFQSAVAAALSSMVGSGNVANSGGDSFSPSFKCGGTIPTDEIVNQGASLNRFMQDGKSFSPSYMTMISQSSMPTTTNSQAESGRPPLLQPTTTKSPPPFPFSLSRSSSSSMPNSDTKKTSFLD